METLIANVFVAQRDELNGVELFDSLYLSLRTKEQRIYSDGQLMQLPNIDEKHPYYNEWKIRKQSACQLIQYLKKKKQALQILEIGCGNGWLANKLAAIDNTNVLAIDSNTVEISQAKRVFKSNKLQFEQIGFKASAFSNKKFDVILFAASIQYFPVLKEVLTEARSCLTNDGEIHILDTNFYETNHVDHAIERTNTYFKKMGHEAMAANYFHHQWNHLKDFDYQILYHPKALLNRLFARNPFYWICIKSKQ